MPARYKDYGEKWQELNPEFQLHDWSEEEVYDTKWQNQEVLDDLRRNVLVAGADVVAYYTQVADVIDYELVFDYGGWYFNTDLKPLKPLEGLGQDMHTPALAMEDDVHAVNMAMYGPPNHELYRKIIENLPGRYFGQPGAFMNATTGVQLIMQTLAEYHGSVVLYHRDVFNPIHWSRVPAGEYPAEDVYPPNTVAVHEWLHRTNQRHQRVLES